MVSCAPVYPQGLSEYEDKENLDGGNCTWMDETFVDGTVSGLQKMLEVKNCAGCQPPVNLSTHFLVHCPLRFHFFCLTNVVDCWKAICTLFLLPHLADCWIFVLWDCCQTALEGRHSWQKECPPLTSPPLYILSTLKWNQRQNWRQIVVIQGRTN